MLSPMLMKMFIIDSSSPILVTLGAMPFLTLVEILGPGVSVRDTGVPLAEIGFCRIVDLTVGMASTGVRVAGPLVLASGEECE